MARILIVEDERVVAWNIRDILRIFKHEVVGSVSSGPEAIQIATDSRPDLVLMDIRLRGEMDGITAAQQILNHLHIPVVYLTAHADEQTLQQAIATAPFGYVIKPFNRIELHAVIETALSRHERQRQIEAAQRWLEITLNSVGDAMITTDKEGRITFMNPIAEEITGWRNPEVLGKSADTLLQLTHADTGLAVENPLAIAIREGIRTTLPDNCVLRTRNGAHRSVGDSAAPIRDETGEIIGGVLIFQDITERKQAEAAYNQVLHQRAESLADQVRDRTNELEQAYSFEALLRRIITKVRDSLDCSHILQIAVDELSNHLNIRFCNTALYTPLSNGQYRYTITNEYTRHHPELSGLILDPEEFPSLDKQLMAGQTVQFCLALGAYPSGWAGALMCAMIDDQGDILGDILLLRDRDDDFSEMEVRLVQQVADQCAIAIRQARLYEAAREQVLQLETLNRLKDEFLSNVSHELRTPMSNINLATHMLEAILKPMGLLNSSADSVGRYFNILQEECQKEIKLINDLLDLSRLEAGIEPFIPISIELPIWLPHIIEPFLNRAAEAEQTLTIDIADNLPILSTDPTCLARIFTELLSNACKFTPVGEKIIVAAHLVEGSPHRSAAGSRKDGDRARTTSILMISVSNTGIQIPSTALPQVFDKFYRIPEFDTQHHGGTGLGLALVKRLAEHLKATIWVESTHHHTRFTLQFELPA